MVRYWVGCRENRRMSLLCPLDVYRKGGGDIICSQITPRRKLCKAILN